MDTRWILAIVVAFAVCHVMDAQLQASTGTLNTTISQTGCGSTKVCVSNSTGCDPSGNVSCYFSSIALSNQSMVVELSGSTTGYVALGLTFPNQNSTIVFVCGNNSNNIFFQTATKNVTDSNLNPTNLTNVTGVQATFLLKKTIQCVFSVSTALVVSSSNTTVNFNSNTTAILNIFSGIMNGTTLGSTVTEYDSKTALNLTISPNTTSSSVALFNINRTGCASTKLCLPAGGTCDISSSGSSCFFTSVRKDSQSLIFELSGTTPGYVALVLNKTGTNVVFVCGNNGSKFFFDTYTKNGTKYVPANVGTINSFRGFVNTSQNLVQCIFNTTTSFNVTARADDLGFVVSIESGNVTGGVLGEPKTEFSSNAVLDLGNPAAATTTNTSGGNSITSHWTYVMAVLLGALALHFM